MTSRPDSTSPSDPGEQQLTESASRFTAMRDYWARDEAPLWFSVTTVGSLVVAAFVVALTPWSPPVALGAILVFVLIVQVGLSVALPAATARRREPVRPDPPDTPIRNALQMLMGLAAIGFGVWGLTTSHDVLVPILGLLLGFVLCAESLTYFLRSRGDRKSRRSTPSESSTFEER